MEKKTVANWKRHTMIWLTKNGRDYAATHIYVNSWENGEADLWKQALIDDQVVPGIICNQSTKYSGSQPFLQMRTALAGFSHWKYEEGYRLRATATFQVDEVWKTCSPFDLCTQEKRDSLCNDYPTLKDIFYAADKYNITLGLFGSTALEFVTGYPYRNSNSDLDLYIRPMPNCDLEGFGIFLHLLEEQTGIRLDVEVEMVNGYGVKLKELLSSSTTVLGKGLYDVRLLKRKEIFNGNIRET